MRGSPLAAGWEAGVEALAQTFNILDTQKGREVAELKYVNLPNTSKTNINAFINFFLINLNKVITSKLVLPSEN